MSANSSSSIRADVETGAVGSLARAISLPAVHDQWRIRVRRAVGFAVATLMAQWSAFAAHAENTSRVAERAQGSISPGERIRLSLALARTYRLLGQSQKALALLESIRGGPWPSPAVEADFYDELARNESALGRTHDSLVALRKAVALHPTAERRFRLSQLAERVGQREEALRQLKAAVAAEPTNFEYKAALAYALRQRGELAEAAKLLFEVLAANPERYMLHEELGYIYLTMGENEKAIAQFKWAIDNQQLYPTETAEERLDTERRMQGLRETISSVEPHWTAFGYSNLCLTGRYCTSRTSNLGSIISENQGGLEVDYQPPGIGYIDGRTLQGFARTFFNYRPGTIDPQGSSFQGGVGVHYKPLSDYNLVLSGERLFKLGGASEDNWLARASFSTSTGYIVEPAAGRSRYSLLYVDLAATLAAPHQYLTYADGREGVNFYLPLGLIASPFVYGTFRGNYGIGQNSSAESGIGLSLRGFFAGDEYHAPRGAVEVLPRVGYTFYNTLAPTSVVVSIAIVARY